MALSLLCKWGTRWKDTGTPMALSGSKGKDLGIRKYMDLSCDMMKPCFLGILRVDMYPKVRVSRFIVVVYLRASSVREV